MGGGCSTGGFLCDTESDWPEEVYYGEGNMETVNTVNEVDIDSLLTEMKIAIGMAVVLGILGTVGIIFLIFNIAP